MRGAGVLSGKFYCMDGEISLREKAGGRELVCDHPPAASIGGVKAMENLQTWERSS